MKKIFIRAPVKNFITIEEYETDTGIAKKICRVKRISKKGERLIFFTQYGWDWLNANFNTPLKMGIQKAFEENREVIYVPIKIKSRK